MSGEKTEEATDKKKEDSAKKGQVAVSKDAQTLFKLIAFYLLFFSFIDDVGLRFQTEIATIFGYFKEDDLNVGEIIELATLLFVYSTLPFVLICVIVGMASTWMQTGFVYAPEAIEPSFKKFDVVQNVKGMFSKKSLVQLILSAIKIAVLFGVSFLILVEYSSEIVLSYRGDFQGILNLLMYLLKVVVYVSLGVFLVLSFFDWMAVFFDHKKNLMMSKNEVKDEQKQMYGDMMMKGKMKQLHRNLMNASLQKVASSKVVVANPTHIAVALDYEPGKHDIPFILAMGEDDAALLIRKKAEEAGVPIIRSVQFARQLYAECDEDEYIKEHHLKMAAEIFKLVFEMSAKKVVDLKVESK
jgi:type III secretion protein U